MNDPSIARGDPRIEREVWRSRGELARREARELRERSAATRWFSQRFREWKREITGRDDVGLSSAD